MTTFDKTSSSDLAYLHDVFRVTLTAPSHFWETANVDSQWFGQGLQNIWDADTLDGLTPYAPAQNPYAPGDLAATIDFLMADTGPTSVSDLLGALRSASEGGGLNFEELVTIDHVEKIVGANAIPAGTPAAASAVTGFDAQNQRNAEKATADAASRASGSWLDSLENTIGTAGKWVVIGGTAFVVYYLVKKAGALRNLV